MPGVSGSVQALLKLTKSCVTLLPRKLLNGCFWRKETERHRQRQRERDRERQRQRDRENIALRG